MKLAMWIGAGVVLLVGLLAVSIWRSPPFYTDFISTEPVAPIMTMAEYGEVFETHARPYVVNIESSKGAVLVYGSRHTKDPDDPQIADIGKRWQAFEPSVALVEGRLGFFIPVIMNPVRRFAEMGALNALARSDGIPVYSWEPPRELEIASVLEDFPPEQVALSYVLRPYFGNLRFGRPDDPDAFVEEYRQKRTKYPGLEGTLESIGEIDSVWQRDFAGLPDWRDTSDEYGLPGYLAEIATSLFRDEHLVNVIIDLVDRGERVFVVAGESHSVKVERALQAALGGAGVKERY